MVRVGCHVSIAGSIDRAVDRALERTCDTFQIFTRNPRGWKSRELSEREAELYIDKLSASGIGPAVAHMPYLPNLATPNPEVYEKSLDALIAELQRCDMLQIPFLITHLGSHLGAGHEGGIRRFIHGINAAFSAAPGDVMLLLENTAATRNSIGGSFSDIRTIMNGIERVERIGVCYDTCHGFAAGYEMRTEEGIAAALSEFDETIGIEELKVVHLNDSKGVLGGHLDRHEHIGMGTIGEEGFRQILRNPDFRSLPLICETPVDARRDDRENIQKVRELAA
jgi:deoxyribonuclease-4